MNQEFASINAEQLAPEHLEYHLTRIADREETQRSILKRAILLRREGRKREKCLRKKKRVIQCICKQWLFHWYTNNECLRVPPYLTYPLQALWPIRLQWTLSSSLCFTATHLALLQDFQPTAFLSFSTVLLHAVLGCPLSFALQVSTSVLLYNHCHSLVLLSISSLDMTYGHLIFNILLKHLNIKVYILLLSTSLTLHA